MKSPICTICDDVDNNDLFGGILYHGVPVCPRCEHAIIEMALRINRAGYMTRFNCEERFEDNVAREISNHKYLSVTE